MRNRGDAYTKMKNNEPYFAVNGTDSEAFKTQTNTFLSFIFGSIYFFLTSSLIF